MTSAFPAQPDDLIECDSCGKVLARLDDAGCTDCWISLCQPCGWLHADVHNIQDQAVFDRFVENYLNAMAPIGPLEN